MQTLHKIYQSLEQPSPSSRLLSRIESKADFTPWNSLNLKTPTKRRSKVLIHGVDDFLKTSRVKSYSQHTTPSRKKESIKRTSYCFQGDFNTRARESAGSKRYSLEQNTNQLPEIGMRVEKKIKIKSYNEQEQLKKYATIQKLSTIDEDDVNSSYKTMFLLKSRPIGIELRNKNIQMIRHISQRKMVDL